MHRPQPSDAPHTDGLSRDLPVLLRAAAERRRCLGWLLGSSLTPAALLACGGGSSGGSELAGGTTADSGGTSDTSGTCSAMPEETAGPYPGDGSNRVNDSVVNALSLSGVVRSDITSSVAGASGVAAGVPLTLTLRLVDATSGCAALAGRAVYLWHCTRDGQYSLYSSGLTDENYLRGVQETDASGALSFHTIVPGCYAGRMPHVHFEVYPSLAAASSAANKIKTSQLTFPLTMLNTVYAVAGYETSVSHLAGISLATDNVFSDGVSLQMATVSGDPVNGYTASLEVAIGA